MLLYCVQGAGLRKQDLAACAPLKVAEQTNMPDTHLGKLNFLGFLKWACICMHEAVAVRSVLPILRAGVHEVCVEPRRGNAHMYVKGTRASTRVTKKMALKVWRTPSSPASTLSCQHTVFNTPPDSLTHKQQHKYSSCWSHPGLYTLGFQQQQLLLRLPPAATQGVLLSALDSLQGKAALTGDVLHEDEPPSRMPMHMAML